MTAGDVSFYSTTQSLRKGLPGVVLVKGGCQETPRLFMRGCESLNSWNSPECAQPPRNNAFSGRRGKGNWLVAETLLIAVLYHKEVHTHKHTHTLSLLCCTQYKPERMSPILKCWPPMYELLQLVGDTFISFKDDYFFLRYGKKSEKELLRESRSQRIVKKNTA